MTLTKIPRGDKPTGGVDYGLATVKIDTTQKMVCYKFKIPGLVAKNLSIEWDNRFLYLFSGYLNTSQLYTPSPFYSNLKIPMHRSWLPDKMKVITSGNWLEITIPIRTKARRPIKKAA